MFRLRRVSERLVVHYIFHDLPVLCPLPSPTPSHHLLLCAGGVQERRSGRDRDRVGRVPDDRLARRARGDEQACVRVRRATARRCGGAPGDRVQGGFLLFRVSRFVTGLTERAWRRWLSSAVASAFRLIDEPANDTIPFFALLFFNLYALGR